MDFFSPEGTDSLVRNLNRTSQRVAEQLQIGSLDMRPIRDSMPSLRLSLTAGPDNIVNNFLRSKGMHFDSLSVKTSTIEPKPLRMILRIDRFSSGGIVLDTITTGIWQNGSGLNCLLRLANSPGNMDNVAQIALFGRAQGNRASLNCRQRTRSGELGFDFGLNALWIDSVLTISMFPEHPTLGFEKWSVNEDNRIAYRAGGEIEADLTLTRPGQRFSLRTLPSVDSTLQALTLNIVGIDIGSTLALFPGAPPLGGRFGTNLDLRTRAAGFQIGGTLTVDSLTYDRQRIGDLEVALNYRPDSLGQNAGLSVDIDGERALAANGVYRAGSDSPLDFDVTVPGIPLAAANAFMPAGTVSLAGMLRGEAGIRGKTSDMRIDGELTFAGTNVGVPMIGTSFGLSETPDRNPRQRSAVHEFRDRFAEQKAAYDRRPDLFRGFFADHDRPAHEGPRFRNDRRAQEPPFDGIRHGLSGFGRDGQGAFGRADRARRRRPAQRDGDYLCHARLAARSTE